MMAEFTGERVVPGHVNDDLWNEHFARYAFVTRFAAGLRVLDCGCGAGYGSAELATVAAEVTGLDIASDAIAWAREHYTAANLSFEEASCTELPFPPAFFDVVTCFEVIEHLKDWPRLLSEARRVLAPGGLFVVSTPNKLFYAESRRDSGPNPWHEHEFEYEEFRGALADVFPNVSMYLEDHVESIVFRPAGAFDAALAGVQPTEANPRESAFFFAICAGTALPSSPAFVFVPRTANALREKALHIERLASEVATKDRWIAQEQAAQRELLGRHAALEAELKKSNGWAGDLAHRLEASGNRVVALQEELAAQQAASRDAIAGYETELARAALDLDERTRWVQQIEAESKNQLAAVVADRDRQTAELGRAVDLLHEAEALVEERTRALRQLEDRLRVAQESRWLKLGRRIGLGPELGPR